MSEVTPFTHHGSLGTLIIDNKPKAFPQMKTVTMQSLQEQIDQLRAELATTQQKLVEAEARVEGLKTCGDKLRAQLEVPNWLHHKLCDCPHCQTLAKTNRKTMVDYVAETVALIAESPSDALRAYEQERFRERTEGVVKLLENEINSGDTLTDIQAALIALKTARGENK